MVQGEITKADTPTIRLGATPSGLVSDPPPSSPIFRPDALLAVTLPLYPGWTGTRYAGLHTQCLVFNGERQRDARTLNVKLKRMWSCPSFSLITCMSAYSELSGSTLTHRHSFCCTL